MKEILIDTNKGKMSTRERRKVERVEKETMGRHARTLFVNFLLGGKKRKKRGRRNQKRCLRGGNNLQREVFENEFGPLGKNDGGGTSTGEG